MTSANKGAAVLEWHRTSSASIIRPLGIGMALLSLGPVIAIVCFVLGRTMPGFKIVAVIGGGLCTLIGPLYAMLGLARAFRDDAFLAAKSTGVTFERNQKSMDLAWEDLETIVFDPPRAIVFRRRAGEPFVLHESWSDIATETLAKRLEDLRRKASFDLLKPT